jgi:hypothetical protein
MRRRRILTAVLATLVLIAAVFLFVAWPVGSRFTVSPQTTYVTEPLDKDGYVDYVTALNERLGKGITPENNANVLICQALGPHPNSCILPVEYFQWMGIDQPSEKGEYFVSWYDYWQTHLKKEGDDKQDAKRDLESEVSSMLWTAKGAPELADWLQQVDKPLTRIVEATRRPAYYNPLVPNRTADWSPGLIEALLPTVQKCRGMGSALLCRAMARTAQGSVDEAWQDLLACHRLGRLVSGGGTLIELLAGIAIEQAAHRADLVFLEHAKLTSKQVLACWADLEQLPPMATTAEKMDLGERFILLDTMMLTARHGLAFLENLSSSGDRMPIESNRPIDRLFTRGTNWDPALTAANRWCDRIVACLRMTDREARTQEIAAINEDLQAIKRGVPSFESIGTFLTPRGRGELMGDILIVLILSSFEKIQLAEDRCQQEQRNLHVAFALAAYQRDHGRYPAKLDELRPKYTKEVPGDLFSGRPLIYLLVDKGYLLYSIGPNGGDDDGRGRDDEPRGDDLAIRIPVPPPSKK